MQYNITGSLLNHDFTKVTVVQLYLNGYSILTTCKQRYNQITCNIVTILLLVIYSFHSIRYRRYISIGIVLKTK